jgi:hypothetical protein
MLTDTQCRTAKPKDKPYKLPDGKGLYLEIKPSGVKAWRYRFELREGEPLENSIIRALGDRPYDPNWKFIVVPQAMTLDQWEATYSL